MSLPTSDQLATDPAQATQHPALSYALSTLGCGVRHVLGEELDETPREQLIADLSATFRGADELKSAVRDAYTRSLQSLVVGLKQAWLLMETGGEHDYCEAFGEVRAAFVEEEGIEGPLLLTFLDGFFLDYDTALDAEEPIFGLEELPDQVFFGTLLDAGRLEAAEGTAQCTGQIRAGLTGDEVALEEEHPIVRLGCWRDLLAEGLHFHFTELCRHHPSWSRYLESFKAGTLEREEGRAIAKQDERVQRRLALVRQLIDRREVYKEGFGEILPNLEWLFDIADRLEDVEETVESDVLKGAAIAASDLPKIVAVAVGKVHAALGTTPVGRISDVLTELTPGVRDVLRRARRDFRRCHWSGEDYGQASLQLAGAMLPVAGPGAAERYYREALAFGADVGTVEFSLFLTELLSADFDAALRHLLRAAEVAPERYAIFDFNRYRPQAILGAGGSGPTFLVETESGERAVVKSMWDPVSSVDPRPGLRPLALLHKQGVPGLAQLLHLGVNLDEFPYITTAFVEGDDFESVLEARGGQVPHMQVCMLGSLAASRLAAIHEVGSVHGNVKPGNMIMGVGEEGLEVTLLDPCIPNVLLAAPGRVGTIRRLMAWSCTGRVIAEDFAAYTAPELVREGLSAATPQSDVYSLGGVLYRLATGIAPRQPNFRILPSPLRPILKRCLAPRPEDRPATAAELVALLDQAANEEDTGPEPEPPAASATATAPPPPPAAPPAPGQPAGQGFDPFQGLTGGGAPPAPPAPEPATADPFSGGLPGLGDDPFAQAPPAADPFAPAGAADPFAQAPPAADPFAPGAADPFAPAGAGADPFAQAPPAGDPFAPGAGGDPFAQAPTAADPFAPAGAADPFAPAGAGADPFAQAPPAGDPFAPGAGGDPFAGGLPGLGAGDPFADPLAAVVPADPFAAVPTHDPLASQDPFLPPFDAGPDDDEDDEDLEALDPGEALAMLEAMMGGGGSSKPAAAPSAADPFGASGEDPFGVAGGGDPFAAPGGGDPFAAPGGGDPFAAGGGDPFAAGGGDPFAAGGGGDPFAAPGGGDPFAAPGGGDPFAAGGGDPFAASGGGDPFAAGGGGDPFAAGGGADPFGASGEDPFAAAGGGADPFGASGEDPFAAAGGGDPFAAAAGGGDPFAAAAGGGDPFAAAAGGDPFAAAAGGGDPFAAAAGGDPFAAAAGGGDPFAAAAGGDPFAAAAAGGGGGGDPFAPPPGATSSGDGGLWLSADAEAPAPAPAPKPKPKPKRKKADAASYGLVISGLGVPSKKEAAVQIVMEVKGISLAEAEDMCRASVVPVLKNVTQDEAEEAKARFKSAKIICRVTSKKKRRR